MQKRVSIFRIENKHGIGPYTDNEKLKCMESITMVHKRLIPSDDKTLVLQLYNRNKPFRNLISIMGYKTLNECYESSVYQYNLRSCITSPEFGLSAFKFAFKNKTQLRKWFSNSILNKLKQRYHISEYSVLKNKAYIGDSQVMYKKRGAKLLRKIKIEDYIKGLKWN